MKAVITIVECINTRMALQDFPIKNFRALYLVCLLAFELFWKYTRCYASHESFL